MNPKYLYTLYLKSGALMLLLCIVMSCANTKKNSAEQLKSINIEQKKKELSELRKKTLEQHSSKISDHANNGLRTATLVEYIANTPGIKFDKKFPAPFDINFDKVIAYDYEGSEEPFPSVIDKNGNFIPIIDKQIALTATQIDFLINEILTANSTYGGQTAACFQPHLGFVFFNKTESVFVIDVCLGCNYLISDKNIPATEFHKFKFENGEEYPANGFSEEGKKKIRNLATEIDFYYSNKNIKTRE
jgi:hypothetical protein